jgi:ribonuclease PH
MVRIDRRAPHELRPVRITPNYLAFPEGSTLIEMGLTKVLCTVTAEDRVPPFLRGRGSGWVTAEYAMLPRSTQTRTPRESVQGRIGGRTQEIQRLIGRALRAVTKMEALGERTFLVDCDVIQADGGTRTAAITGAYVALVQALLSLSPNKNVQQLPLFGAVAAVSVGIVQQTPVLDLCYEEDRDAEVDFNVVMTDKGEYVELQGTAEHAPFSRAAMDELLRLADGGIRSLLATQQEAISRISQP